MRLQRIGVMNDKFLLNRDRFLITAAQTVGPAENVEILVACIDLCGFL